MPSDDNAAPSDDNAVPCHLSLLMPAVRPTFYHGLPSEYGTSQVDLGLFSQRDQEQRAQIEKQKIAAHEAAQRTAELQASGVPTHPVSARWHRVPA